MKSNQASNDNMPTLKAQIFHPKFGTGEVIAINGYNDRLKCVVRFGEGDDVQEKKLLWFVAYSVGAKIIEKHVVIESEGETEAVESPIDEGLVDEDALDEIDDVVVDDVVVDDDEE